MIWRLMVAITLTGIMGCAATFWAGKASKTVSFGMSKEEVQTLYGPPQHVVTQHVSELLVEVWKYADRSVTFRDGTVLTWDAPGLESIDGGDQRSN